MKARQANDITFPGSDHFTESISVQLLIALLSPNKCSVFTTWNDEEWSWADNGRQVRRRN